MKIEIMNWGPVQRCEYDLDKPLIVTYGENNIGKSYVMQVVYLLLKNLLVFAELNRHIGNYAGLGIQLGKVEECIKAFAMQADETMEDITDVIFFSYTRILEDLLLAEFRTSLENTFGTFDHIIKNRPVIKLILGSKKEYTFLLNQNKIEIDINEKNVYLKKTTSDFHKSRNYKDHYDIYVFENRINSPLQLAREKVFKLIRDFAAEIKQSIKDVYFLPASRSGIYTGMSSFGSILAQISQSRTMVNRTFRIQSIPEPISDYYMELTNIRLDREEKYEQFAREIEDTILKGSVGFDSRKKTIMYQSVDVEQELEMSDVSSMVSEISPIVAFLKYIVRSGTLRKQSTPQNNKAASFIFIEEPEAHLHPLNQIKLMKVFMKLSMSGVHLIMASHSNYIFNELNNRVIAGDLDETNYSPIVMKWENGKSRTSLMEMDEFGVSDTNFSDAAELLYDEREELIVKLMEQMENNEG